MADKMNSLRGHVIISDMTDSGKKEIFSGDNMIIRSGRKAIFDSFFNDGSAKISRFYISGNDSIVDESEDLSDAISGASCEIGAGESRIEITSPDNKTTSFIMSAKDNGDESDSPMKHYVMTVSSVDGDLIISSAGLMISDGKEFSRVLFPRYEISKPSTKIEFDYYLYF